MLQILGQGVRVRARHKFGVFQGRQSRENVTGYVFQGRGADRSARRFRRSGHRLHQKEVRVAREAGQRRRILVPGAQRRRDAPMGEYVEECVRTRRYRHAVSFPDSARSGR